MADRQFHLADLFEIVVDAVPDRVALLHESGEVTFARMNDRAERVAAALYERGLGRGDKIGLYLMNGPEYLEAFFGVMKIGAVPFNVNYRYRFEELKYLFDNSDAKAVIHGCEFSDLVRDLKATLPTLDVSLSVKMDVSKDFHDQYSEDYNTVLENTRPAGPYARSEDDYLLQYTGGTTGLPKGVMWPHKAFFYACLGGGGIYLRADPIGQPEAQAQMALNAPPLRILPVAPLMHGAAIWTALAGILGGITIVLDPMRAGFDADSIWSRVEREQVNILQIVGDAMAVPLLDSLRANPDRWNLQHLIHLGSGGAVFSDHVKEGLQEHLPTTMMGDGMGTSETGISGMGQAADGDGFMKLESGPNQSVIIDDRVAVPGETGFLARTGYTPIGYYKDEEKSAEVFRTIEGQLWAISGDQAILGADGMITILGRGSTCINSGGEKIYPEEVEGVLRFHPSIHDAAVLGVPDPKWGQCVGAVISLTGGADDLSLDEVQKFCRKHLASYKLPRLLRIVDEISRSPAGKQDYKWAKSVLAGELTQ